MDTRSAREPPKRADPFYLTPEWKALMAYVREVRADRCEVCGRTGVKLVGDHVIAVKDGGPLLDSTNIRLTCFPCHSLKSHAERLKRMAEPI
jgi:5-methylcytosine-specific restriction endonuclease McrA